MAVPAFKHLTRPAECSMGGTAYLSALDSVEISRHPQFIDSRYLDGVRPQAAARPAGLLTR
jgi:hypothetical protein